MDVRENGNYEQWILFFLKAVSWSAKHAIDKIKEILVLQSSLRKQIMEETKASIRTIQLLDQLYLTPMVTVNDVASMIDVTYQGAKDQVSLLVRLGILEELTGQKRGKRYAFAPYLKIIKD